MYFQHWSYEFLLIDESIEKSNPIKEEDGKHNGIFGECDENWDQGIYLYDSCGLKF